MPVPKPIPPKPIPKTAPVNRPSTVQEPYSGTPVTKQVPAYTSMSAFAILVIIIGIFILLNVGNFVGLIDVGSYKKSTTQFNSSAPVPPVQLTPIQQLNMTLVQAGG